MDAHHRRSKTAWCVCSVALFAVNAPVSLGAIELSDCKLQDNMMEADATTWYELGTVLCQTASATPMYAKSSIDTNVIVPTTATAAEITQAFAASPAASTHSATLASTPQANFAKLYSPGGTSDTLSAFLYAWTGNVVLKCGTDTLIQQAQHAPPTSFLYTLKPVQNAAVALWESMGAKSFGADPTLPGAVAVGFIYKMKSEQGTGVGTLTKEKVAACLAAGTMKVAVGAQDGLWTFTDASGTPLTDPAGGGGGVTVTRQAMQCDVPSFEAFAAPRMTALFNMLETSTSRDDMQSAIMTYASITQHITYKACSDKLQTFYTTTSRDVVLQNVKACANPNVTTDPCCNRQLLWGDCCVPSDKTVTIDGLYGSSNLPAIQAECPTGDADAVKRWLDDEISHVIMSAQHPEYGCDVEAANIDNTVWETVNNQVVYACIDRVFNSQNKQGQNQCSDNQECYSGSCMSWGTCQPMTGSDAAEPLLECLIDLLPDHGILVQIAKKVGFDSSQINSEKTYTEAQWDDAVQKFKTAVATPNCAGSHQDTEPWCLITLTKAECEAANYCDGPCHVDPRQLKWIDDPASTDQSVGWCKKKENNFQQGNPDMSIGNHNSDAKNLAACQLMFTTMQGHCVGSQTYNQGTCTGAGATWVSYTGKTVEVKRLKSLVYWEPDADGQWHPVTAQGDQTFCEAEKRCNWDPDGRVTNYDETKCTTATGLTSHFPSSTFVDSSGNKMACLQCWGSHCHNFYAAAPATCAVATSFDTNCQGETGGAPDGTSAVTAISEPIEGDGGSYKCRRYDKTTTQTCLIDTICPAPAQMPWQHKHDFWIRNCEEPGCFDLSITTKAACEDTPITDNPSNPTWWIYRSWREGWKNGAGICALGWHTQLSSDLSRSKSSCDSAAGSLGISLTWWEGRIFKDKSFADANTCTTYCDDRTWPPKETCTAGENMCDAACPTCLSDDKPNGVCVDPNIANQSGCAQSGSAYKWDWESKACYTEVSSTACAALSGHAFYTCQNKAPADCAVYCWHKDQTSQTGCESYQVNGQQMTYWMHNEGKCAFHGHVVKRATSLQCSNFTSDQACNAEGWPCQWIGGTCQGLNTGCNVQAGTNEWVQGTDTNPASGNIRAGLLRCRWSDWEPCPTEATCVNAGECHDWWADGGACLVPHAVDNHGHRMGCDQVKNPVETQQPGASYAWADRVGCVVMKHSQSGGSMKVPESECNQYANSRWATRQKTKAGCESHGAMCSNTYNKHDIYGGFTSNTACQNCGHQWSFAAGWRGGNWKPPRVSPLKWVQRTYASVNSWDPMFADEEKFKALVMEGIAMMQSAIQKSRIMCKLGAFATWIPPLLKMCQGGNTSTGNVDYSTKTQTAECGSLQQQAPANTYETSVDFSTATCGVPNSTNSSRRLSASSAFCDITINKVVPLSAAASGSGKVCAKHETIVDGSGVVGQTVGPGMKVTCVSNVQLCITPSVVSTEICTTDYPVKDIVELSDAGVYGIPLGKTVTVNAQGQYCFQGAMGGKTYVPVLIKSGYTFTSFAPTPAPGAPTPPTPAPAPPGGGTITAGAPSLINWYVIATAVVGVLILPRFSDPRHVI